MRLPSGDVLKVYEKQILYKDLNLIPKISHYVYANTPKSEKNSKSKTLNAWSHAFWIRSIQPVILIHNIPETPHKSGKTGKLN
jgi:hypothetical protein